MPKWEVNCTSGGCGAETYEAPTKEAAVAKAHKDYIHDRCPHPFPNKVEFLVRLAPDPK